MNTDVGYARHTRAPRQRFLSRLKFVRFVRMGLVVALLALTLTDLTSTNVAQADTSAASTLTKTGTDAVTASTANAQTPTVGTTQPGNVIKWAVSYTNNTGASAAVNIKDPIVGGQTYVPGSLQLPPSLAPQYSTNGGTTYSNGAPVPGSNAVGGVGTVPAGTTNSASPTFTTAPLTFTTPGGDGYSVQGLGNNIYTVYHHERSVQTVFCATLTNATCPGWGGVYASYVNVTAGTPLGTGGVSRYTTAGENGSFIENGKLYWGVQAIDRISVGGPFVVGLQCLDLTTRTSCGLTQLSTTPRAPSGGNSGLISSNAVPAADGNYYFFDGDGDMLCFNATSGACGSVNIAPGLTPAANNSYAASMLTQGNFVYVTFIADSPPPSPRNYLTCYNITTQALCSPTFPIDLGNMPNAFQAFPNTIGPVLSTTGALLGACDLYKARCVTPAGVLLPNPYVGITGVGFPVTPGFGDGGIVGTRFYFGRISDGKIQCKDFALWTNTAVNVPDCTGFNGPTNLRNYTVRALENVPGCFAAVGDAGVISLFDGSTGGSCVSNITQVSLTPSAYYCDGLPNHATSWGRVFFNGLDGSEFAGGALTLTGATGPVAGFQNLQLAPGQTSIDISSLPVTGNTATLTASVVLTGVTNPAKVALATVTLSWIGDGIQMCFQTTVTNNCPAAGSVVSNTANVVTTGANSITDAPVGTSSGTATFAIVPTPAQCPEPSITIDKTASPPTGGAAGDVISYSFLVTNTGNVTLTNVTVNETAFTGTGTISLIVCPTTTLAPAAQMTCTASYTLTQADVDAGEVTNTATSTGTPPTDPPVTSPPDSVTVPIPDAPALSIVKSASPSAAGSYAVGQVIAYSFVVTNTGNVTLTNVTVNEGMFSGTGTFSAIVCPATILVPGAQMICTASYTLTQADVDAGTLSNTATSTGTPPLDPPVTSPPSEVTIPNDPAPSITIDKTASPPTVGAAGDVISYSFLVTNTGNVTLTNVTVNETAFTGTGTISPIVCPTTTLAPADQMTCTATYRLTRADVVAGEVTNTATSRGTPPTGPPVTSPPDRVTVPIPKAPSSGNPLAGTGVSGIIPLGITGILALVGGLISVCVARRPQNRG